MKKRLLAAVLAAALALGFSACTLNVNRSEYLDFINSLSETAVKGSVKIEIVYSRGAGPLSQAYIAQGSGVIYEQEAGWYYALTNNHVVAEDPEFPEYTMIVYDCYGNMYEGSVVDSSAEDDLAVVKFPAQEDIAGEYPELKIIGFADDNPDTGDVVASVGAPDGKFNSVTLGRVRGYSTVQLSEEVSSSSVAYPVVCHTAITHQGSSGGMLLNERLEIVGVNFAGAVNEDGDGGEQFVEGYAIPLKKVLAFLDMGGNTFAW